MTKKNMVKALSLLGLTAMLLIGFTACDTGNSLGNTNIEAKEAIGTIDEPVTVEYNNLETWLKNDAGTNGTNFVEISDISNEALKGTENSCSPLGSLISNGNKKVFLILGKKNSRVVIDFSEIGDKAFYGVKNLMGIKFSYGLTNIGKEAFANCTDLVTVDFSGCNKLKNIGAKAFYNSLALESINFSDCTSLKKIEWNNFMWCKSLKDLDFSECTSLEEIGDYSFQNCYTLTSVKFPASLKTLGFASFRSCSALTNIIVDANNSNYLTEKGILFNKDKTRLILYPIGKTDSSYTIPDTITEIGENAFVGCKVLTSVKFPINLKIIKRWAFDGCSLTSVDLSGCVNLETVEGGPFCCTTLTDIIVDENNTKYCTENGILFNKDKTELVQYPGGKPEKSYKVPDSVIKIGDSAFMSCENLETVEFSTNVRRLEKRAFSNSASLTSIKLPASLESIGYAAFMSCRNLTDADLSECSNLKGIEGQVFDYSVNAIVKLPNADIQISKDRGDFGRVTWSSCVKEVQIPKNNTYNLKQRIIDSGYPENNIKEY